MIATPDGEVAIEDLKPGNFVLSYDLVNEKVVKKRVIMLIESTAHTIHSFHLDNGAVISTTPEHPFYDQVSGRFIPASSLKENSKLSGINGDQLIAYKTKEEFLPIFHKPKKVYNLQIEGPEHNYFANGVLVHNKICLDFKEITGYYIDVIYLTNTTDSSNLYLLLTISNKGPYSFYYGYCNVRCRYTDSNVAFSVQTEMYISDLGVSEVTNLSYAIEINKYTNRYGTALNVTNFSHVESIGFNIETDKKIYEYIGCANDWTELHFNQIIETNHPLAD